MVMALLLCACARAPQPQASDAGRKAPAVPATHAAASITISGDEAEAEVDIWQPPLTRFDESALPGARRDAAAAMQQGRLYAAANDAIPLYLSILREAPQDRRASEGLHKAQQRLLQEGIATLRVADRDEESLAKAWKIAEVARTLVPKDPKVMAFQRQVEQAARVRDFNRVGEEDLRAGRLGDVGDGALQQFRAALALMPGQARAEQGLAAVESAMIRQAELAAQAVDYPRAYEWLQRAQAVRTQDVGTLEDARARIEAMRHARIAALHEQGMRALSASNGLKAARTALEEILRIADPGDTVAADLRGRIDLVTHYGAFRAGQVFTDAMKNGGRGPQMIVVPHGAFQMGASDTEPGAADAERPSRYVRFDRGFAMSLTEVTVADFGRFVASAQARPRATRRGHSIVYDERSGNFVRRSGVDWRSGYDGRIALPGDPVLHVSVRDAEAYAAWLSQQTGRNYRLPSEAEFEYALRAGDAGRYPWGNAGTPPAKWGNVAGGNDVSPSGRRWNNAFVGYGDGFWGPAPAGSFHSNAWGLYDLSGNVNEWVADCWHASYRRAPVAGVPWFNPGCRARVVRGGSWASSPVQIRSAWRSSQDSDMTSARVGFRLVRGI